jgi:hypothetical protein
VLHMNRKCFLNRHAPNSIIMTTVIISYLSFSGLYDVRCTALMEFAIFKCIRHLAVLPTVRLC